MAKFSVVVLAKEDAAILTSFCVGFARLGAAGIHVHYDGALPDDDMRMALEAAGPVTLTACDAAFWKAEGIDRPTLLEDRQRHIYAKIYAACDTDWLLACDSDEFLISSGSIAAWLDTVPAEIEAVNFPTAEAVWAPGEDIDTAFATHLFRLPFADQTVWRRAARSLYGPAGALLKEGLAGHSQGKCMIRTGLNDIAIRLHWVTRDGHNIAVPSPKIPNLPEPIYLAHFDAISFERWARKFARRAGRFKGDGGTGSGRREWQKRVANSIARLGRGPQRWLFQKLYCLNARQIAQLSDAGLLIEKDLFSDNPTVKTT